MRTALFKKIYEMMRTNEKLFFLTAGVGFNLIEPMCKEFPAQTMNVGIAEANLVGVAAGLSNIGFKVICYSYTNFLAERAFEQIRNDICLHRYAPILVGTTTGFDNAGLGATHHALDDIAVLKALPHLRIYSPSSSESMETVFDEAMRSNEASFIRMTKSNHTENKSVQKINRFIVEDAYPVLVITHGKMLQNVLKAHDAYPKFSIFAMDRIKPLDEKKLKALMERFRSIAVIEDNFKSGLYNSIAQYAAERRTSAKLYSISVEELYRGEIGDAAYLEDINGLSPKKIAAFLQSLG